ncbi:enoyl-CoA hydratase/isomerase family protein [Dactylosporangium sp. NPDC051485]|uniref:enoyl-CoA hydratase/isomerase family protein n=1 Tax=Dactylosporangium sp. NPDC051485 TaxID=3154846 RepID=UPI00341D52EF
MEYADYQRLIFEQLPDGVLLIRINRPDKYNAADPRMLMEFEQVWLDVAADPQVRVVVITGVGKAFSAGGDIRAEMARIGDATQVVDAMDRARGLVLNMLNCDKPIISAINGVAVGAGLAIALLADISIIGEDVRLTDGHMRIGLAAGDHSVMLWPLLCGIAKAKYYLLTAKFIDGREADRIGLVSECVPTGEVLAQALAVAQGLATGPQWALQWTKRSINHWLRAAQPAFESSLALEMLSFFTDDAREGMAAMLEKRPAIFPGASGAGVTDAATS